MQFWVLFFAAIVNFALALVIFSRAVKASSAAYFGISGIFVALWAIGTILMMYANTELLAYVGLILFLITPMFTTLYMVLFAKSFSGVNYPSTLATSIIFSLATSISASAVIIQLNHQSILNVVAGEAGNLLNFSYSWYMLYGLFFSIMFMLAYAYLFIGALRGHGKTRSQLRIVLIGIVLTSATALVTNILLPFYGNSDFLWVGPTSTIFYIVATCYAMVKHGLFDLRSALVLTFTYLLSLSVLAGIYYLIGLAVSLVFSQAQLAAGFNGLDVAIALALAFLFQPIRRFFDKLTNDIFYQDNYSVDDFFAELSSALTSTNDLHSLLMKASEKISLTMKASNVSFVVNTSTDHTEQVGVGEYSKVSYKDVQWLDEFLGSSIEPKVLSLIDEDDEPLRRLMISHRIVIILPLIRQGRKMGYLFLGEHKRSTYSARDIRVVRSSADELVIAIQNALSVEQIKQLNAHLEQRVDAATKELRRSNAQLQKLDEAKDDFISMASHQLRTPLTSIKGYISMLMEGDLGKVSPEQKRVLNEAFISSERMVRLISDFLNVSRLQTGKFMIDKHPVDLAKLVQRELDSLSPNAQARGMSFQYTSPKNIPEFALDENKIQQVVMNFCDNAIYYAKEEGKIVVSLKKIGDWVEFRVKDKGIGVPAEDQPHLFNKFFRAPNAKRARPDGTGVGLFLAKKVIDDHDGEIIFESVEGKGSTFGFRLPIPKSK